MSWITVILLCAGILLLAIVAHFLSCKRIKIETASSEWYATVQARRQDYTKRITK